MTEQENRIGRIEVTSEQKKVILVILFCIMMLVWFCVLFRLKEVSFQGLTRYTEEEMKEKLEDSFGMGLTPLFCLSDIFGEKEIPFIESYEINYVNRNTVQVIVHEKRMIGCVLIMGRYMYFDKDGVVVESAAERISEIPVVSGLEFTEIALYEKLKIQKDSLFDTILQLTRLIEKNGIEAEEISFDSGYSVTLYAGGNTVLLGKRKMYDEPLNALPEILQALGEKQGTLDMRNYSSENTDVIFQ